MNRTRPSIPVELACARQGTAHGPARREASRPSAVDRPDSLRPAGTALATVALLWLALGCSGLLSAMAFTDDPDSLVVALVVWVLGFVAPSLLASAFAYRAEDRVARNEGRSSRGGRWRMPGAGFAPGDDCGPARRT